LSGLQKLEQRAKKCIELRGEYVEKISLVAVTFFLPGRAKDLSAPHHIEQLRAVTEMPLLVSDSNLSLPAHNSLARFFTMHF
jgi:hypothetical protein